MKCCTQVFQTQAGLITQTIPNIVDHNGNPFVGQAAIIHGNAGLRTLQTYYGQANGFDTGSVRFGEACDETPLVGVKNLTRCTGGDYSTFDELATLGFGGTIERLAKITAFRAGEVDITYALNSRPGDYYAITVLGDDLFTNLARPVAGVNTLGFAPEAVLFKQQTIFSASHSTSGDSAMALGWATQLAGSGAAAVLNSNAPIGRYQRSTKCAATVFGTQFVSPSVNDERTVTAWSASGYTLDGGVSVPYAGLALGNCRAVALVITQPLTTGLVEYSTVCAGYPSGVQPRGVLLLSVGAASNSSLDTSVASWSFGMMDATRQNGYWTAENVASIGPFPRGARYLSDQEVLRFATSINAGSTTFGAVATSGGFSTTAPSFFLNWTQVDGVQREILALVLADPWVPPPTILGCNAGLPLRAVTGRTGCIPGVG